MHDTAVIMHPLSVSDRFWDPPARVQHFNILLALLRDLQERGEGDTQTTLVERRARMDSIGVLMAIREGLVGWARSRRESEGEERSGRGGGGDGGDDAGGEGVPG